MILVTGLPRSGTSWAGRMLCASGKLVYVNEPLNPERPYRGVLNAQVAHRFQYICRDNEQAWLKPFQDTLGLRFRWHAELPWPPSPARFLKYATSFAHGRLTGRQALLDDPFALWSAEWFADRLDCRVVILTRDPITFVGSWEHLGWTADPRDLLAQPLLLRDHPHLSKLSQAGGRLERVAALWKAAHDSVLRMRHPNIRVVGYESLATDPHFGFRDLYEWCGIPWTDQSAATITRSCTGTTRERGFTWQGASKTAFRPTDSRAAAARSRLSAADAARISALLSE
ncbi:sulfotransferase [Herbidospora mongoliensis]|uniref:sulfotransferase n=1 Tax=Herbidospora mongoliensis TaxID=688067 RepID=UPI000837A05C|nr:sulfotransferase [Herbidospora mongoliensis]